MTIAGNSSPASIIQTYACTRSFGARFLSTRTCARSSRVDVPDVVALGQLGSSWVMVLIKRWLRSSMPVRASGVIDSSSSVVDRAAVWLTRLPRDVYHGARGWQPVCP